MKKLCSFWCFALFYALFLVSYHPAGAQSNQWAWMAGSSSPNNPSNYAPAYITPSARYGSATWTEANGTRWLYGGAGTPVGSTNGYMNDLWKFDVTTNLWTWVSGSSNADLPPVYGVQGVASPANTPGGRRYGVNWLDGNGNLWLFGGNNSNGWLNDLWKYNIASGTWTWMKGNTTNDQSGVYGTQGVAATANTPGARQLSVGWADASGNLWVFGGYGRLGSTSGNLNELWKYNIASGTWTWVKGSAAVGPAAVYGTQGIAAAANTPAGSQGSTAWTDRSGNFWLFGGINVNGYQHDLWKFTVASGNWTWIKGTASINVGATYGTQGVAAAANNPGSRYASTPWVDASGDLWLLGGTGFINSTSIGKLNDLWRYNISTGNWTWMKGSATINTTGTYGTQGIAAATSLPGARETGATWLDASGNLILFGGSGYGAASSGQLSDVWKYDITTGNWIWIRGSMTPRAAGVLNAAGTGSVASLPGARKGSSTWMDNSGNLWLFGGNGYTVTGSAYLGDMWKYNVSTGSWAWVTGNNGTNSVGVYGTVKVPASVNTPGARQNSVTWKDNSGNLWLFGGFGYGTNTGTAGYLNDLWKYDISTGMWTWMKGGSSVNATAQYGTQGTPASYTIPGARTGSTAWTDASGNLWLFGGMGNATSSTAGFLSDLWKYDITTGNWTWMKGPNSTGQVASYGTMGTPAATNRPGARNFAESWTDNTGNLWLFGGNGFAITSSGWLNDLWKYDVASGNWTWIEGGSDPNLSGVYGIQGIAAIENTPGARAQATAWKDGTGNLWLSGGNGYGAAAGGYLNDIWKYDIATGNWTWIKGSTTPDQVGVYGSLGVSGMTAIPGARMDNLSWADNNGTLWIFGGDGYTASTSGTLSDFWKYKYCNALNLAVAAGGQTLAANHTTILAAGVLANFEADCAVSTAVLPNGVSPVVGITTAKVWVESAEPAAGSNLFIRRHYEVNPVLNAGTATGRITLYATQADFDNFNLTATSKLPTSPTDLDGIGRLRVFKYNGTSANNSGLPTTYSGNFTEMYVGQSGIVWNSNSNWWEISLDVSGFGGFFIGSSNLVLLPVDLTRFSAARQGTSSLLLWTTTQDREGALYSVERSADGYSFQAIGSVAANNTPGAVSYSFTDATPIKGANYYRLRMTEKDGKRSYSEIRLLNFSSVLTIALYPNPAKSHTYLYSNSTATEKVTVQVLDNMGREISKQVKTVSISIPAALDVSKLNSGSYVVKITSSTGSTTERLLIQ